MASIFRKNWDFIEKTAFFAQLFLQYGIRYALRTSKRYIIRVFIAINIIWEAQKALASNEPP